MRTTWLWLGLAACGGEGLKEIEFIAEYEELFCEGYALCANDEMLRTVNHRECLEHLRYQPYPLDRPDCRYEQEAASACIEGLKQSGCTGVNPEVPQVCEDVWSLCPYPRIPAVSTDVFAPPA